MKRLTSKEVSRMMEEVNQLAELTNPVMPSAVRDEARKKLKAQGKTDAEIDKLFADMDAAAQARLNPTPEQRKAQVERDRLIQQAGGGVAGEKAATERLKNNPLRFLFDIEARGRADVRTKGREALRQLGDGDIEKGLEIFRAEQEKRNNTSSSSPEPSSSSSVPAGSFNISPKGSTRRNEVEAQIKRDNAARTDDQRVQPKQPVKQEKRYSFTANGQTYNMTKAEINSKYDELRKNPTQAKAFGIASNNAIFKKPDASTVKTGSSATLSNAPKNDLARGSTPIVVNRETSQRTSNALDKPVAGSMAQRLQAIRAQQGRPQTPSAVQSGVKKPVQSAASRALNTGSLKDKQDAMNTVNNNYASSIDQLATDMMIKNIKKPKPAVTPNQQSSIQQKVTQVKQPVQSNAQSSAGSPSASERVAEIRAKADAARQLRLQNMSPAARRTLQDIQNRRTAARNRAAGKTETPMRVTTGSGANATTTTYAAGTSKSDPNVAAEIKTTRNLINKASGTPTGNTIKTKVNPDSSIKVTQKRSPEATAKIKKSLDI
jgi:hypothetical protein|tara:strand:+ start:737 stop:2377 length:1641 start_codon:yes stop_codon:yes gene_type:complete